jgi:hypothetical protein
MQHEHVAEMLKNASHAPMSESEVVFLRDVQAFIDFAIRNGLSFQSAMTYLSHDWNEYAKYGFDFETVANKGFYPKVSGFSEAHADAVGEPV